MLSITNEKTTYIPVNSPVPVKAEAQTHAPVVPEMYRLGMFGTIVFQIFPDEASITLSDRTVIQKGDVAGVIDLMEDVDVLNVLPSEAAQELIVDDYKKSLAELAQDLKKGEGLKDVKGFTIICHIFSREETKSLGFDVIEITDETLREQAAEVGTFSVLIRHKDYDRGEVFKRKLEKAHIGWISAKKVIELYGEQKKEEKIA